MKTPISENQSIRHSPCLWQDERAIKCGDARIEATP